MNQQTGHKLTAENLQDILDSAKNAADIGAQQFVTPPPLAAAVASPLPRYRGVAADFQCGHGALLTGIKAEHVMGIDIQPEAVRQSHAAHPAGTFECADITVLYPLLAEAGCQFDLFALNPPFSLQWHTERLRDLLSSECEAAAEAFAAVQGKETIDSTLATFLMALDRLTVRGEGVMICSQQSAIRMFGPPEESESGNQEIRNGKVLTTDEYNKLSDDLRKSVESADKSPLREHVWAWVHVPQCTLFANAMFDMAIIYFARDHRGGGESRGLEGGRARCGRKMNYFLVDGDAQLASVQATLRIVGNQRLQLRRGLTVSSQYDAHPDTLDRWQTAVREHRSRKSGKPPKHNLWLEKDGRIGVYLTPFQQVSTKLPKDDVKALWKLKDQFPAALVVQKFTRCALIRAVKGGIWTVEPSLIAVVELAVKEYDAIRAPFFPLNPVQRLGFLDEEDSILCKKDFNFSQSGPDFKAGIRYPLTTATRTLCNFEQRMNLSGQYDKVQISGCEMVITITSGSTRCEFVPDPTALIVAEGNTKWAKKQKPQPISNGHDLAALVDHFEIPHVRDIAEIFPDRYEAAIAALAEIELAVNAR